MKILTPIMSASDIDILNPKLYNTEFFCGYLPQWWINEYNDSKDKEGNLATPINNRMVETQMLRLLKNCH